MNKFITKLQKVLMNCYGPDELYKFLLYLYVGLFLINLFLKSTIISALELLIVIIMFYRFFSKKRSKRYRENQTYLKLKKEVLRPFKNIKRNIKDRDYHIYKKCPHCKTTLKLPLPEKRGFQHVKCPKCHQRLTFFTIRKQKIEIIKNKRGKKK